MAKAPAKTFYDIVRSAPQGRFSGIKRNYSPEDVLKLRGSLAVEHTLANRGANRLWSLLHSEPYVHCLGAITGNQAVQMVRAGLNAIYLSGWQVAADNNTFGSMYPDQGLYPVNSGPDLCRKINNALTRADQIESVEGGAKRDWFAPIVADCEAGFGGALNCYEIAKSFIEAGAAGIHYEDQLSSEKKCGHLGGKVLISTGAFVRNLNAARLAADVAGSPTLLVARTDAESATLLTTGIDERDQQFVDPSARPTPEGFLRLKEGSGLLHCISRGLATAPFADLLWFETSTPNLKDAQVFAEAIRKEFPEKMLAYNCSPSFNWEAKLSAEEIAKFQRELGAMGYKFQFITLAGFHSLNYGMFQLARGYKTDGMTAFAKLQHAEFEAVKDGYTAVRHQREVGTGFFDCLAEAAAGTKLSTTALKDSTETAQFTGSTGSSSSGGSKGPTRVQARAMSTKAAPDTEKEFHLTMPVAKEYEGVLSADAVQFLIDLETKFRDRRAALLENRKVRQDQLNSGQLPNFRKDTKDIRESSWSIRNTPDDLQDRRVEITGPVDRKMVINALNSGARTYMADFEDSTAPFWHNVIDGQKNLIDAVRKTITFTDSRTNKLYKLSDNPATLLVRPRGWHLPEKHVLIHGKPMSGSLFDFGLFFFHNAKELLARGSGPYFYVPKLQNAEEAKLWDDVFTYAENRLKIPHGSIKVTVLIEHLLAAFECDEILNGLKDHIVGLNCGRWDYIFSYIKTFQNHPTRLLPDRSCVTMTTPFMRQYALSVIHTCHKRKAHAMGGMAAQIPIKGNKEANDKAMTLVRKDKEREVTDGHDGTWVAHPGLVPLATQIFDAHMQTPNQVSKQTDHKASQEGLIEIPRGTRTIEGLAHSINVTLGYLEAWLRGTGCVPLHNLMEDAATAEISRALMWQWVKHSVVLDDGTPVDLKLVSKIVKQEMKKLKDLNAENKVDDAADLLMKMVSSKEFPDFLTLSAYDTIVSQGH